MKNVVIILLVLIISSTSVFTQIDTTSLSYYPLNDGDYWEHVEVWDDYWWPYITNCNYFSHQVIGDTTFPNQETYKIIKKTKLDSNQAVQYFFERIDTSSCNVYSYDSFDQIGFLIDSLKSQIGDSSKSTRSGYYTGGWKTICIDIANDTILNYNTNSKTFYEQEPLSPITYNLSQNLGLTYLNFGFDFGQFTRHLLYARIDNIEYGTPVNTIENDNNPIVNEFQLHQNYPNPFNSTTIIPFELPQKSKVEITIYDVTGRKIKALISGNFSRGVHNVNWDGTNQSEMRVSSGIYIYTLKAVANNETHNESAKLILLR